MSNCRSSQVVLVNEEKVPILIVEEKRALSDLMRISLEGLGYAVWVITKPIELIPTMERVQPSLVLVDLFLTGQNGLEVLEKINRSGWMRQTKVMVLSALGYRDIVSQAIRLGVDDFIVKPFDVEILVKKVQKLMRMQ